MCVHVLRYLHSCILIYIYTYIIIYIYVRLWVCLKIGYPQVMAIYINGEHDDFSHGIFFIRYSDTPICGTASFLIKQDSLQLVKQDVSVGPGRMFRLRPRVVRFSPMNSSWKDTSLVSSAFPSRRILMGVFL